MQLTELIETYGYLIVFLGGIFEGETILLLGGFIASEGFLKLHYVMLFALMGAVIGDTTWFLLGKYRASSILRRFPSIQSMVNTPVRLITKHPRFLAGSMRFMYGFRTVIPLSLGMSGMKVRTFVFYNFLGAVVWTATITYLGYLLGDLARELLGTLHKYEFRIIIGAVLMTAVFLTGIRLVRFIIQRSAERELINSEKRRRKGEDARIGDRDH